MKCELCQGKGLIPFKKNGLVVPYAWQDCLCKADEPERYVSYSDDLIDFPIAWCWHRQYRKFYDAPDPGPAVPPPFEREEQVSPAEKAPMLDQRIDRLRGDFVALTDSLKGWQKGRKKKPIKKFQDQKKQGKKFD